MTKEKAIKTIESAKIFTYDDAYMEAFDMAIDAVRKCQKIQELMRGWNKFNSYDLMCGIYDIVAESEDKE